MGRRQMIAFTRGMANGAMKGKTVVRSCEKCGLGFPKYVGRYPETCPQCKGVIAAIAEAAVGSGAPVAAWGCTSMVPRIQKILDAGDPADAPCGRSSKSFVVRYDEMARQLPGGVQALTNFMEGPDQGRFYRVESPDQPVLVMELDDQLQRARLWATEDPAAYLGRDPREEFVDMASPRFVMETDARMRLARFREKGVRVNESLELTGTHGVLLESMPAAQVGQHVLRDLAMARRQGFAAWRDLVLAWDDAFGLGLPGGVSGASDSDVARAMARFKFSSPLGFSPGAGWAVYESLEERGGAGAHEEASKSVIGKPRKSGEQTSPYGGFRIHVGGDPQARARNRKPRMDMQRAMQNKRNARRGLAKRVRAAKEWHASPDGERLHRALGRYNKQRNKRGPKTEAVSLAAEARMFGEALEESMRGTATGMTEGAWGGYVKVTHDEWQSLKSVADTRFAYTKSLHNVLSRAWRHAMRDGFPVVIDMRGPTGEDEAYALQKLAEYMFQKGHPSHRVVGKRVLQQMLSPLVRESTNPEDLTEGAWGGYVKVTHDEWQSLKSVADTRFAYTKSLHNVLSRAWRHAMRDGFPVVIDMRGPTGEDEAYALQKLAEYMFQKGHPSHRVVGKRVLQQMLSPLVRESTNPEDLVAIFDSLKTGERIMVAMKAVMGMGSRENGSYHPWIVGRRAMSRSGRVSVTLMVPSEDGKPNKTRFRYALNKSKSRHSDGYTISASSGDMAMRLIGIRRPGANESTDLAEVALLQSRRELEDAIYKAKVGKTGIDAYSLKQQLKRMDDDALLRIAQHLGLAEAAQKYADLMQESVNTFKMTRIARIQAPQIVEAAADKYAETIDDVLDDILRKLLVTEDLDILQDVEFDEATGSIYLFFDPSLRQEEVRQVYQQLQGAYNELALVASPDMSLPEEQAPADWWVMFLPRNIEEEAPPAADPSIYSSAPDGAYMKQQIVVPAPVSSPEQIAQSLNIDQAMTNIGGGTAEAIHGLAATSPALAERLLARMARQRDTLMRSRS